MLKSWKSLLALKQPIKCLIRLKLVYFQSRKFAKTTFISVIFRPIDIKFFFVLNIITSSRKFRSSPRTVASHTFYKHFSSRGKTMRCFLKISSCESGTGESRVEREGNSIRTDLNDQIVRNFVVSLSSQRSIIFN